MALPIWGIFMRKVLTDGTLGVSEEDRFIAPAGGGASMDCASVARGPGDDSVKTQEEYYFE